MRTKRERNKKKGKKEKIYEECEGFMGKVESLKGDIFHARHTILSCVNFNDFFFLHLWIESQNKDDKNETINEEIIRPRHFYFLSWLWSSISCIKKQLVYTFFHHFHLHATFYLRSSTCCPTSSCKSPAPSVFHLLNSWIPTLVLAPSYDLSACTETPNEPKLINPQEPLWESFCMG